MAFTTDKTQENFRSIGLYFFYILEILYT